MNDAQFGAFGVHGGYSSSFTVSNGTERSSVASPASGSRGDNTNTASPQKLCRQPGLRHDAERPTVASLALRSTYCCAEVNFRGHAAFTIKNSD